MAEFRTRDEEIQAIWKKYSALYRLAGAVILIGIGVLIGRVIYSTPEAEQAWGYGVNLFTSVLGVGLTVLILDDLNRRRAKQEAEEELKRQLVDEAASTSNEIAKNAVHQLRRKGWLVGENGLLQGADLRHANLRGANLHLANLQGTKLDHADLQGARIDTAKMRNAHLFMAKLQGADLNAAYLEDAYLGAADLRGADLRGASLNRTYLHLANLQDADLGEGDAYMATGFYETTILPDEGLWSEATDMRQFTDPKHPRFWRSDHPMSPAK